MSIRVAFLLHQHFGYQAVAAWRRVRNLNLADNLDRLASQQRQNVGELFTHFPTIDHAINGAFFEQKLGPLKAFGQFFEQLFFSFFADARAIVEQAFRDAAFHQELVVPIGKPVGFITNTL